MWFAKSGWYHNMIPTKKRERRTPKCLKYGSSPLSQDRAQRRCRSQHTAESIAELNAKLLMLEQLRSKGYLAPEVYQAQANEINAELAKLKDVRQEKFNSKAATMLEKVRKLKMLIFELEEPLEAFDEKLFLEIVKSIQINKEDEMSVELLGGLRFRERI